MLCYMLFLCISINLIYGLIDCEESIGNNVGVYANADKQFSLRVDDGVTTVEPTSHSSSLSDSSEGARITALTVDVDDKFENEFDIVFVSSILYG